MKKTKKLTDTEKDQPLFHRFTTWFYKSCGRRHKVDQAVPIKDRKNLLDNNEIFWTIFEPKTNHRHIVTIKNLNGEYVFPTYVIRKVDRPRFDLSSTVDVDCDSKNRFEYQPLKIVMYDPIVPSIPQAIYKTLTRDDNCYNICIRVIGPVGDTVEEWEIKSAKISNVCHSEMDWSKTGDPATITVTFEINDVTLKY